MGRANSDADALSQYAITDSSDNSDISWKILAAIDVDNQLAKEGEETLSKRQMADPAVAEII